MISLQARDFTSKGGGVCQETMTQANTKVAQHCGVCEVALPPANGQLCGKVLHHSIRHP